MEKAKHRVRPENWGSAHPNEGDNEQWKHSPTTESTGDTGSNARIDRERAREENAPSKPAAGRDSYGTKPSETRKRDNVDPRTPAKPLARGEDNGTPSGKAAKEKRDADRDEALRESFPASDPPPVSPGSE